MSNRIAKLATPDEKSASRNGKHPPTPPDKHRLPKGGELMDKVEIYGWEIIDKSGRFQKISKRDLHVDHDYQRDSVKHSRINRIASRWSWVKFQTLSVARRPDGSLWVFDGQHRKLAADKRSDIDELPCMVYTSTGPVDESRYFLDTNCDRGSVGMLDRFKALIAQNDPTAVAVRDMVQASGYKVQRGVARNSVQCVGVLMRAVGADPEAAQVAWDLVVSISDGDSVVDRIFQGIYAVQRHLARHDLGSLADAKLRPFVSRLTPKGIQRSIGETAAYFGRGGPKVYGEAVLRLLNKGRKHKLPSLYADTIEGEADAS